MQVLIIEDEPLAVRKLHKLLNQADPSLSIEGVTNSIEESVLWLKMHIDIDIIFMDIELADGQSYEIFKQVDIQSHVIFTTSYSESTLEDLRETGIDYLLKPIQLEDLKKCLGKIKSVFGHYKQIDFQCLK